jgi:hypothetical protein|tara:strand:+ start:512 stop:823 length:312 start_codon:yes stop_codon:yes gene_type:complete
MNYKFQFTKLWYPTKEILEIIPISRSTFYLFQDELTAQGRDLSEMGRVKIKGCENIFWDPVKLLDYLNREKVNQPIKYDYEKQQQDDVNVAIGVFNKQQRKVN